MSDGKPVEAELASKKRIVFLINSLAGGGAERVMTGLLAASAPWSERYELHLVLLDIERDAYPLPSWLPVHRLDCRFSFLRSLNLALPLLRKLKPTVCLSFLTRANFVTVLAGCLFRFPVVISERVSPSSHHDRSRKGQLARLAMRIFYPYADRVICPSAGVAKDLIDNFAIRSMKTDVIPNPVNQQIIREMSKQKPEWLPSVPYIVTVGRLVENKNIGLLLSALRMCRTDLHLVIMGEGPLHDTLERDAEMLGLADRVHFLGFVENPFPIISKAQFFVSSSNAEGFPNAIIEAMALGVPVIATNCRSGPSEILDEKICLEISQPYEARYGMLVPAGDVVPLATAIDRMANAHVRDEYSRKAEAGVARFSTASFVRRVWEIIENPAAKTEV